MIKYISQKIADQVTRDSDEFDPEIVAYGYELILQELTVIAISIVISIPFGLVLPVLVTIATYMLLRMYAGGMHAKYRIVCVVSTVIIIFGPAALTKYIALPIWFVLICYVVSSIFLFLYAPADTVIQPITDLGIRKQMRTKAFLVLSLYFLCYLVSSYFQLSIASIFVIEPLIVSLLTTPFIYKVMGCQSYFRGGEMNESS